MATYNQLMPKKISGFNFALMQISSQKFKLWKTESIISLSQTFMMTYFLFCYLENASQMYHTIPLRWQRERLNLIWSEWKCIQDVCVTGKRTLKSISSRNVEMIIYNLLKHNFSSYSIDNVFFKLWGWKKNGQFAFFPSVTHFLLQFQLSISVLDSQAGMYLRRSNNKY